VEYDIENLDDCKVKLYITIDEDERDDGLVRSAKRIGKEKQVSGFRKGKAPVDVIMKNFQKEVFEEFLNEILPSAVELIVEDEKFKLLDKPEYEITNADLKGPVEFTALLYLFPEFELPEFSNIKLDKTEPEVKDEEVENLLNNLAERNAELEDKGELSADAGDMVTFNWEGDKPEWLIEGPHSVIIPEEQMTGTIEGQLIGAVKDKSRTISIKIPPEVEDDRELVDVDARILNVEKRIIPEIDDELAKKMGSENLDELRERVRKDILNAKEMEERKKLRDTALERLAFETKMELPVSIVEWYRKFLNEEDKTPDEDIRKHLKRRFIIDKLGERWEIKVDENELKQEVLAMAQQMGIQKITDNFVRMVHDNIYRRKVLDKVVDEMLGEGIIIPG
jgi:trigger factor